MKDRQPTRPGRVKITPESGEAYYATMEMADEPTEAGTPPTKNNLLKDTTAAMLGGDSSMVPDEALVALKALIDSISPDSIGAAQVEVGSYTGTGKSGSSNQNTLTFSFVPKLVFVYLAVNGLYAGNSGGIGWTESFVWGAGQTNARMASGNSGVLTFAHSERELSWYYSATDASATKNQCNVGGSVYHWVAIG